MKSQPRSWWRVSGVLGALALVGIATTLRAAERGRGPRQARLSWTGDPRTSMTVTWQVTDPATTSHVEFGTDARKLDRRAEAVSSRYAYETGVVRHATLSELRPGAQVYYRIVGNESEGTTEVRSFRTAPDREGPFTFTAYGDQGVSPEAEELTARVVTEKPAFHLHLGDLSYANQADRGKVWDEWLELITPLAGSVAYMPSLGNHENERLAGANTERVGYVAYLARFALPAPETRYSFDYAGARFVAPNSDDFKNPEQLAWLRETLKAARADARVRWLIVFQHHPPYSSNVRRENNKPLIAAWEPVLDEFKVDLVMAGHNHNYERTLPMRGGQVTASDARRSPRGAGTVYVISGGAGKGLYDFEPERPAWCAAREKAHNYLRVRVEPRALTVTGVRKDGSVIEQFTINGSS